MDKRETSGRQRTDKRLTLTPLEFEKALEGLLQTKPPPEKRKTSQKERPSRTKGRLAEEEKS